MGRGGGGGGGGGGGEEKGRRHKDKVLNILDSFNALKTKHKLGVENQLISEKYHSSDPNCSTIEQHP